MGVTQPVLGIGCEGAVRVGLDEGFERARCFFQLIGLEEIESGFVIPRFGGRVCGFLSRALGAGWRRTAFRCGCSLWFKLAQTIIEIDVKVLLAFFGRIKLVLKRFNLAAQASVFLAQRLNLVDEFKLRFRDGVQAFIDLYRQILDLATGFIVIEHAGAQTRTIYAGDGGDPGSGTGWTGDLVGADPVISGLITWASCKLYINGVVAKSDFATAGDGHDVSCLARLD